MKTLQPSVLQAIEDTVQAYMAEAAAQPGYTATNMKWAVDEKTGKYLFEYDIVPDWSNWCTVAFRLRPRGARVWYADRAHNRLLYRRPLDIQSRVKVTVNIRPTFQYGFNCTISPAGDT